MFQKEFRTIVPSAACYGTRRFVLRCNPKVDRKDHDRMRFVTIESNQYTNKVNLVRPFSVDIGEMKIHCHHRDSKEISRCQIIDVYPKPYKGRLEMFATILLIDVGIYKANIPFSSLYDVPSYIRHLKTIEPECVKARLMLDQPVNSILNEWTNKQADDFFKLWIRQNYKPLVCILGSKDDVYYVDLKADGCYSIVDLIKEKFSAEIERHLESETSERLDYQYVDLNDIHSRKRGRETVSDSKELFFPVPLMPRNMNSLKISKNFKPFRSAKDYFNQKVLTNSARTDTIDNALLPIGMFKVKILYWADPTSFYFIPNDPDYIFGFDNFRRQLDRFINAELKLVNDEIYDFEIGQVCLFKNTVDQRLGGWLRGFISAKPNLTEDGFYVRNWRRDNVIRGGPKQQSKRIEREKLYEITSVDYGFVSVQSPSEIRKVFDSDSFQRLGSWSLRCGLFGIFPFPPKSRVDENREFSQSCNDFIDSWVRQRLINENKNSCFNIIFRSVLRRTHPSCPTESECPQVTLFHKDFEPLPISECFMSTKGTIQYTCLNQELVNRGFASDTRPPQVIANGTLLRSRATRVAFDEHVVNMLARHNRIK